MFLSLIAWCMNSIHVIDLLRLERWRQQSLMDNVVKRADGTDGGIIAHEVKRRIQFTGLLGIHYPTKGGLNWNVIMMSGDFGQLQQKIFTQLFRFLFG